MDVLYSTSVFFAGYCNYILAVENIECCRLEALSLTEDCAQCRDTALPLAKSFLEDGTWSTPAAERL